MLAEFGGVGVAAVSHASSERNFLERMSRKEDDAVDNGGVSMLDWWA